ncbi:SusD/RagB family nutrient-binding outer membrane lipoprotein, partial [bacterium]|nr:SusD/RagB family nutrient-binding outer membrane lipoprotein [bacterium]
MKSIIKFAIVLTVFGALVSCEDYLDVNVDPNNPTSVTPDLVLPVGQYYTALYQTTDRGLSHLGNMFMVNWSQSDGFAWYADEFKYNVTSSFYQGVFNNTYANTLKQYQILFNLEDPIYDNYKAIAKIMKAYHFQLLVDCYGDVPYSEALGRSNEATPKYDDAQEIYDDLIVQLTEAIALIKGAPSLAEVPGSDDAIFGGNMLNWIRFANTLKLRILTRQSDMSSKASYITTELGVIASEGHGFILADVGVNPGYIPKNTGKQNPMWNSLGWDEGGTQTLSSKATCASEYIIDYLTSTNDPRIDKIYEKPSTGHLGVPQGLLDYDTPVPDQYMPEKVSNIGPGILKAADMDAIIFTLAESYFNQAELRQKGLITTGPSAQALYESGITASFVFLGLTSTQATTYFSQSRDLVNWGNSPDKIEAIITQKWIAVNGLTAEQSWFDYSRTGFPSGIPIPLNYNATADRPVRIYYPAGEYSSNGENVPTQP